MPLPQPKSDETEKEFINRCMGNNTMNNEFPDQKQRAAVCYSQYEKKETYMNQRNKDFSGLIESAKSVLKEEVDVKKIIKDLAKSYGESNESQGKMVALLKGLAFSDAPEANQFMKALDKWTTEYSKKMEESVE